MTAFVLQGHKYNQTNKADGDHLMLQIHNTSKRDADGQ